MNTEYEFNMRIYVAKGTKTYQNDSEKQDK